MLRCQPTAIGLTVGDVDLACRHLAMRQGTSASAAPLPRVRRGAQRSWEAALTHQQVSPSGSSAVPEENVPDAEYCPPTYRKDLAKLGVPESMTGPPIAPPRRSFSGMTLDGIDEEISRPRDGSNRPTDVNLNSMRQNAYAASPLRESHVFDSSNDAPYSDRNTLPSVASRIIQAGRRLDQGCPVREPYATAAVRIRSSQDLFASAAGSLRQMYRPQPPTLHRPPISRLSSMSSPNLTAQAINPPITHSRNASAGAPTPPLLPTTAAFSSFSTPRAVSGADELPMLEIMRHYTSPLEDLEQRFDALSDYASSRSSSSFYTANSRSRAQSKVRFPSFESPPRHQTSHMDLRQHSVITPTTSSGNDLLKHSEALVTGGAGGSPPPTRLRPIALPPPDEPNYVGSQHGYTRPTNPASTVHPRPRNDSGDDGLYFNIPIALDGARSPVPASSVNPSFPVFSSGFDGADDYSRYPDPRVVCNRRSMPTASSSERAPSETFQPSRRAERPYSHGARPRGDPQRTVRAFPDPIVRAATSRPLFNDRMPPRPSAHLPAIRRPNATTQPNQENEGSAEEDMMRHEFTQMQLRGGADARRRSNENAPGATTFVLDDTPPSEGRFERFMRN